MALWTKFKFWKKGEELVNRSRGNLGEDAARAFLKKKGLKFLTANFATPRGEIDLIFRDGDCLVFVEVKTRSSETWTRPSRAVDSRKQLALRRTANDYLRLLPDPRVKYRFDIVEVLLDNGEVREIRHLENSFSESRRLRRKTSM